MDGSNAKPKAPTTQPLLTRAFGLDVRSLALFRIGLALVVLWDLAIRASDLKTYYTDDGFLPRQVLIEHIPDPWHFSLHLLGGNVYSQSALFLIAAASACLLGLGLCTTPATVCCWLLTISLQNRNPLVLSGADVLLRMALFWAMFLPLGRVWSLDRTRRPGSGEVETSTLSWGTAAWTAQVVAVYFFAGLIKTNVPAWNDGLGIAFALQAPAFVTQAGIALSHHTAAIRALGSAVPYLEMFGPILLLLPFQQLRLACVGAFSLFHLIIGLFLEVGLFVPVGVVVWSAFLPARTWDRLTPTIDGVIRARIGSSSAKTVALTKAALSRWAASFGPIETATPGVRRVATKARELLCISAAAYVLLWNICNYREPPVLKMPDGLRWIGPLLRIDQRWDMFSRPITSGGWYVIPARLHSGAGLDLLSGAERISWERPAVVSRIFRNDRWRKYILAFGSSRYEWTRVWFGKSICRSWNAEHAPNDQLEAFKVFAFEYDVGPWSASPTTRKILLWKHECQEGSLKKWDPVL